MQKPFAKHIGWSRPCINLRLSKERSDMLWKLLGDDASPCSPTDAVDHAIAIAERNRTSKTAATEDRLESLARAFERLSEGERREDARDRIQEEILNALTDLRDVIASAATLGENEAGDEFEPADLKVAPTLKDWLDAAISKSPERFLLARAQWRSSARSGARHVDIEIDARPIVIGSEATPTDAKQPSIVRIERVEADHPFARRLPSDAFHLICKSQNSREWKVAVHEINSDGGIGPGLASLCLQ